MKSIIRLFLFIVICLSGVLYAWRTLWLASMPQSERNLPMNNASQQIDIPERPGVKGIMISGPTIEPLLFAIDLSKSGLVELDWQYLMAIDPNADIKINGTIDSKGRFHFSQEDVLMEGHTQAGLIIQKALQSWLFKPYKEGKIQFWFNLPSRGHKLIIDVGEMERKKSIADYIPIYHGQMYHIKNMNSGLVKIKGTG